MIEPMTIRLPSELRAIIKQTAKNQGFTLNALIINILWNWVKQNESHPKAAERKS